MRTVCVFCGSSCGHGDVYRAAARRFGELLAARGHGLVYGGGHVGLMGVLADAVLAGGGTVVGVIPQFMIDKELAHAGLTELIVVETMHQRKAIMADRADAFAALPGGYGTAEELFEVVTWAQLRLHAKPVGLLNVAGYFDPLLAWRDRMVADGFLKPAHRDRLLVADEPQGLLDLLAAWRPAETPGKWREDVR
jgi:uncharacterized protein (TIGR00730 family)